MKLQVPIPFSIAAGPDATSVARDWAAELKQTLVSERGFLLRLAHGQLRNAQWAEDVVQEAALAAWQSIGVFEGRSTLRTWLVGILRFKILDALRQQQKQPAALSLLPSLPGLQAFQLDKELNALEDNLLFDAQGRWRDQPLAWWDDTGEPDTALQQKQVLHHLQWCLDVLPQKSAQVFLLREYLGCDSAEIATHTGLQSGHIRVILMRTRLALRTCLETRLATARWSPLAISH